MCNNDFYIERTCIEVTHEATESLEYRYSNKSLSEYRKHAAYILLGEPGAGKTESFKHEGNQPDCIYIKARDFLTFDNTKDWKSKILFIDGLDEVRAGSSNGLIPLDKIRNKLFQLGKPKFRLSCREADWLGASDEQDLEVVSNDGLITVIHLEEFNEKDIRQFAKYKAPALNIKYFMEWSHQHTLFSMLGNPQILKLIIKAVSGDNWPDNKKDIYQIACEKMILDINVVHQQSGNKTQYSVKQLMDASGKLFAHQLISGLEGYSISAITSSEHYPHYGNIFDGDLEVLGQALKTNLFRHGNDSYLREPTHRSIAEYLAATYVSNLVENEGLPARRLLALITTVDGGIVSSLRGLFAWFITLCADQRSLLLNRDPLGVVLYGDVSSFSKVQKEDLFMHLYKEAEKHPGFRSENWLSSPFGTLATEDMEDVIKKFLESPLRDAANQSLVNCVIDAVEHGSISIGLTETLLGVVEDCTWWSGIRRTALRSLLQITINDNVNPVTKLLNDIKTGAIEDRDDQLLGTLLSKLYPSIIDANNIFDYLNPPKDDHFLGGYVQFWRHELIQNTSNDDIPVLLDQLSQRKEIKEYIHHNYSLYDFISELLVHGIIKYGTQINITRLYDWLGVGLDKHEFSILEPVRRHKKKVTIQQWLSEKPDIYKAIIAEGTSRIISKKEPWKYFHKITARLYGANIPEDIGEWYLKQADKVNSKEISEDYFRQAVFQINTQNNDKSFTLDTIFSWVESHPEFNSLLQKMLVEDGKDFERRLKNAQIKLKRDFGRTKKKTDYINHILKYKDEIKKGTGPAAIFHDLAFAHEGYLMDAEGETSHERIASILNNSDELTAYALEGLKKTIFRDDLPSVKEIIKTSTTGRNFYISHAVLVGLEERPIEDATEWAQIADTDYEKAVAFYLADHTGNTPQWFKQLLHSKPNLISKVFIQYVHASAKSGKEHITGLYQLVNDEDWTEVAKKSVIALLDSYPVRTKNSQIYNIQHLLTSALRYADKNDLIGIIDKKINLTSMNMMQRSRWLAVGLIIAPEKYEKNVLDFMKPNTTRVRAIASFLSNQHDHNQWEPEYTLPVTTLVMLIKQLGSHFKPYTIKGAASVTLEMDAADMVSNFINQLSKIDNINVTQELEKLISTPELNEWRNLLKGKLYEYKKRIRDISFIQPTIENVANTLSNKEPSNAADLMALTLDHLETLATKIRNIDTNDYRQYWGPKSTGDKSITPKVEDDCRDALLSDLRTRLNQLNINAEKEGYFADNKRSDIKISYINNNKIVVPIEIKRDFHANVWKAWKTQLIAQYTQHPDAQGYGIYLIFWFGTGKTPPPPSGKRPTTANEMKKALLNMMTEEEKRLIGLCVIDCSISDALIKKS